MNRSISLLSALTLSSTALLSVQTQEANAMTIAFDCFERSTERLVARSAVDMTSTAISCLPVPGHTIATDNSIGTDEGPLEIGNEITNENEDQFPDFGDIGSIDDDEADNYPTGEETTSDKIADLIGHLIGEGINDLIR